MCDLYPSQKGNKSSKIVYKNHKKGLYYYLLLNVTFFHLVWRKMDPLCSLGLDTPLCPLTYFLQNIQNFLNIPSFKNLVSLDSLSLLKPLETVSESRNTHSSYCFTPSSHTLWVVYPRKSQILHSHLEFNVNTVFAEELLFMCDLVYSKHCLNSLSLCIFFMGCDTVDHAHLGNHFFWLLGCCIFLVHKLPLLLSLYLNPDSS